MKLKNLVVVFFALFSFVNAYGASEPAGASAYKKSITLRYHTNDGGTVHGINVVKVHPHVWIHYIAENDAFMWLNHGMDKAGNRFYYSIIFPTIGMKTYVTRTEVAGRIMPWGSLDQDSKDILALQLAEVERHGGSFADYVNNLLVNRGSFGDDQSLLPD